MTNKVLVNIIVPEIGNSFEVFLPVNEQIWKITKLSSKVISDMMGVELSTKDNYVFINTDNGTIYPSNEIIANTDIRNGTELIMLKK